MSIYTFYKNTGEITKIFQGVESEALDNKLDDEYSFVESWANDETQYIPNIESPLVTDKLANPSVLDKIEVLADGIDFLTITNVPIGSNIKIIGSTIIEDVTDSETIELGFDIVDKYVLTISKFPYLELETTINAT